jgi:hypothetical protein
MMDRNDRFWRFFCFIFSFFLVFEISFMGCASKPVDMEKQNPKLFKELIRTYHIPSEAKLGELTSLEFMPKEPRNIVGDLEGFALEKCTWFLDRKAKSKNPKDMESFNVKKINLNCKDRFYILDFSQRPDLVSRVTYQGIYRHVFSKLKKAIILEASCSISSVTKEGVEESTLEKKNASVECYPYPHDINQYIKEQKREVVVGHFLYVDKPEDLAQLMESSGGGEDNGKIFEVFAKEFSTEEKRRYQSMTLLIGRDFEFSNAEFIDFREIPAPNSFGQGLKEKIEQWMNTDLSKEANKENLKSAIDDFLQCGNRCLSREKETYAVFEVFNDLANNKVLLILKLKSKSDLGNFKRFQLYKVSGFLSQLDFSETGVLEKINLETP